MALNPRARQKAIDTIVSNCDCWKREGDKEILNGLSDDKVEDLLEGVQQAVMNRQIAEFVTNEEGAFTDPDTGYTYRIDPESLDVQRGGDPTTNTDDEYEDEEDSDEDCTPKKKLTKNRETPMTEAEFWRLAPPSLKKQHDALVKNEARTRQELIEFIVVNQAGEDDDEQDELRSSYAEMSTNGLRKVAKKIQKATSQPTINSDDGDDPLGDYSGLGLPSFTTNRRGGGQSDDHLENPVTNYEELSQKWPSGRNGK